MAAGLLLLTIPPAGARSYPDVPGNSVLSHAQVQAKQWWILRLNLRKAWKITRGKGATVAVIDTGVDRKLGDLQGALDTGFGVDTHATGDTDKTYHGTRIADDIAGRGTGFGLLGVAPQAKILPVTVPSSAGPAADAAALNHLAAMSDPPQVINMSFGGPFPCPGDMAAAMRRAVQAGIVLIAGAGNSAQAGNESEYPANCPGVVAVGAVNSNGGAWSQSERRSYVMLTGPGVHIIGFDTRDASGYGFADGTSDSSAMVSGIAALIRAHSPSMSARDVVTRLLATAHQFGGKQGTRNDRYGYGVALPYNALTQHVAANAPEPGVRGAGLGRLAVDRSEFVRPDHPPGVRPGLVRRALVGRHRIGEPDRCPVSLDLELRGHEHRAHHRHRRRGHRDRRNRDRRDPARPAPGDRDCREPALRSPTGRSALRSATGRPAVTELGTTPVADARDVIANRRWVRRNRPFPHVIAHDVFVPAFYQQLEDEFHRIEREHPEAFARNMGSYDASGADLDRYRDGPFGVFLSRQWHDMIAAVAGVRASGDVSASLHHHEPGSASGWPHNDLNPGWFAAEPAAPGRVRVPSDAPVDYQRGPHADGVAARQMIRAVSILYYLGNPPWTPGDGGETGLFHAPRADGLSAAVAPTNNSLVLFECTPFSWHTFLSNRVSPRNSVVMWLHRERDTVVQRWGADRIVGW